MKFLLIKREVSFKNLKIQAPRQVKKKIALHMSLNSAKNIVMRMSIKFQIRIKTKNNYWKIKYWKKKKIKMKKKKMI